MSIIPWGRLSHAPETSQSWPNWNGSPSFGKHICIMRIDTVLSPYYLRKHHFFKIKMPYLEIIYFVIWKMKEGKFISFMTM